MEADYCFVQTFPYGWIPHPMITSQIFALCGVFKVLKIYQNVCLFLSLFACMGTDG